MGFQHQVLSGWINEWWSKVYFILLRPVLKWIIRQITGKCELLRITYEDVDQISKTKRIESSLKHSSLPELRQCATNSDYDIGLAIRKICVLKNIVPEIHSQFETLIGCYLSHIRSYNKVLTDAEDLRKTKYSADEASHEKKLTQLWDAYNSGVPLHGRIGSHWTMMGFQGHDPSTDFRGMGMLGLEQLLYFAQSYPDEARHVLSQSHHPQYGFSFAIVGINITEMGYSLLAKRKLRSHFYGLSNGEHTLDDFHQVYCHLLYEFVQFWFAEKPRDIMEFSNVREKFHQIIQDRLKKPNAHLLSSFQEKSL
ncbi:unnamed protein product [Lymnaea stagnalis]|uniref:ELMO domain-containing protein n=1 Tax=Lymnaea stagnalis TaxID=6523 RepID=A0AAV2HUY1_LYMST